MEKRRAATIAAMLAARKKSWVALAAAAVFYGLVIVPGMPAALRVIAFFSCTTAGAIAFNAWWKSVTLRKIAQLYILDLGD